MKKLFVILAAVALNCGIANAQLNNIINKATSAASSAVKGNSTMESLVGVISSKLIPNSQQIVGTWVYQEPAIMFTSSNSLKQYASSAVTKSIEQKMQSYLAKVGFTKGKSSITFNADKSFVVKYGTKSVKKGTYTLNNNEVVLTFTGKKTPSKVIPQLDNGSLIIVMDATKFKTFMENIGAQVSQLSTVTSALKQMDGMKIGIRSTKQ
ncbi:MAG: DUF4923 family protein [Prevotella sp.]|nr:DUF4923 family protein [Prevotella sp.]